MDLNSIKKYINLCKKAGAVVYGIDNLKSSKKPVFVIFTDITAGNSLKRTAKYLSENSNILNIELESNLIDNLFETTNCKAVGISNSNLADKIIELIKY